MSDRYDADAVERKWRERWVDEETYAYEPGENPDLTYSIDTPPPTVSGNIHWGNTYGFILQDFMARFHRMRGEPTFFPFGYDNNGIASERLTERELGIRHQDFTRREFQEKVRSVCSEYEDLFTETMQELGCSMDWTHTYATIDRDVQRTSQLSFIELYEQGREYRKKAPAIWCPDCETAISQVEMEPAERETAFHDIAFEVIDGPREELVVSTTRPELLPACVAVFVHPEDDANQDLVGGTAKIPRFGQEVPILEDERVDVETGTGVVMCCTFGDQTDIEWYQAHDLPLRVAIDESATMTDLAGEYEGYSTHEAREAIADDLEAAGALLDSSPHTHTVNVHERCAVDVEFRVTEQWYIELLDKKDEYLQAGRDLEWYPEKMFTRYQHWVEGLEWDWCISRQRDSGIPVPVWYCADEACAGVVIADREQLPVDPLADDPPVDACPDCGSSDLVPDGDVFDTWATSSLTPLINAGWDPTMAEEPGSDAAFEYPELYPMTLRPQGHDIISFWLFHTIVKCVEHTGEVPWDAVMVNGMVLDANREKMSKSRGNVVTPRSVLDAYPVDAARFWAAGTSIGDDFPFKEQDLKSGERLLRKLWNASKLVDQLAPERDPAEPGALAELDRWLLAELDACIRDVTAHLEAYEFSKARDRLREVFWNVYCDDYLEIAKQLADDGTPDSTAFALRTAHRTFLGLFAPLLPHVTEELYQRHYVGEGGAGPADSVHRQAWPEPRGYEADHAAGEAAMAVIGALRRYKSERQLPLNAELPSVRVFADVGGFAEAIREVMHVEDLTVETDAPDTETVVTDVSLEYSIVGPEYGERVGELEAALESGDYEIDGRTLHLAGEELGPEMFEVETETAYAGEGALLEAGEGAVVVGNGIAVER